MLNAQPRDARVVNPTADNLADQKQSTQRGPMLVGFREQHQGGRLQPGVNLIERGGKRRRRMVDARMRHDSQEFVQARPRDCPSGVALGETGKMPRRSRVERRIFAMRVDQYVGIDGNQDRLS